MTDLSSLELLIHSIDLHSLTDSEVLATSTASSPPLSFFSLGSSLVQLVETPLSSSLNGSQHDSTDDSLYQAARQTPSIVDSDMELDLPTHSNEIINQLIAAWNLERNPLEVVHEIPYFALQVDDLVKECVIEEGSWKVIYKFLGEKFPTPMRNVLVRYLDLFEFLCEGKLLGVHLGLIVWENTKRYLGDEERYSKIEKYCKYNFEQTEPVAKGKLLDDMVDLFQQHFEEVLALNVLPDAGSNVDIDRVGEDLKRIHSCDALVDFLQDMMTASKGSPSYRSFKNIWFALFYLTTSKGRREQIREWVENNLGYRRRCTSIGIMSINAAKNYLRYYDTGRFYINIAFLESILANKVLSQISPGKMGARR